MTNERHEPHQAVAQRDDDARRQRQLGAKAGEQVGERRNDLPQNDADHDRGDDDDRDRVDHRGLDLALQLDGLLDVGRQALQNRVENTARLAGGDHVGEQRVERFGVLLHRIGQRRAALDVGARREDDRRRSSCPLPALPRISRHCTSGRPASIITENWRVKTARFFALTRLPDSVWPARRLGRLP